MAERLTDTAVKALPAPDSGNRITYDDEIKGFGVRVTSAGARAFVLNYRTGGRERRITIGAFPDWTVKAAREEAKTLKRRVDVGADPMAERHADRGAPTVNALADRFEREHVTKKRPATQVDYASILRLYVRPELGTRKVAEVRHADIERLHRRIAATAPYRANRTVAVLSKMFNLAVKWELRSDNPAKGIERAQEEKRERFLAPAELTRLAEAMANHNQKTSANALRLLLLTGARRGEMLAAKWDEIDFGGGVWVKPSAHTKQKKLHRVPLSAPTLALLRQMRAEAAGNPKGSEYVFPGFSRDGKATGLREVRKTWLSVCRMAGLAVEVEKTGRDGKRVLDKDGLPVMVWKATLRIHDLRHSYASILASAGLSLPIIGALLGHTQAATTARYAHLLDDPLRDATERVGVLVQAAMVTKGGVQ